MDRLKKQFIRWYYGHFNFDRYDDVYSFGAVRPLGAIRLSRYIAYVQRHWQWVVGIVLGFCGALVYGMIA